MTTDSTADVSAKFQNPSRGGCDLVMKGGITSGVIYPQAVLVLAEEYRFRAIGGGSVGAVAAALTAAAELGRESGGFEKLANRQRALEEQDFLLKVFRPSNVARPLFDTLVALVEARAAAKKKGESERIAVLRGLERALRRDRPEVFVGGALLGMALGVGLFFAISWAMASALGTGSLNLYMLVFGGVFGWLFGYLWVAASLVWILVKKVPARNFYGMCIGHEDRVPGKQPLLTDWLSEMFDELAGKKKGEGPLTFGDLKTKDIPGKKPEEPAIDLKVLATNLNHREPYMFPRGANTFLFKEQEMGRFFPGYVVKHMCDYATRKDVELPAGYRFLPSGDELPIIVPVRMGLSFPILLSTVPLYTIEETAWARYVANPQGGSITERDLQPNLFSDSGICSNFPIHFFDAWLPKHPTFGINLTSVRGSVAGGAPEDDKKAAFSAGDTIGAGASRRGPGEPDTRTQRIPGPTEPWLPKPDDPDSREWTKFGGLVGFGLAILYSAMNYRDNMQSRLPSYQERSAQVPLGPDEGGLNLNMAPGVIASMVCRGKQAGEKLRDEFDFDRHRWVRLRLLLNQLEAQLENAHEALNAVIDEKLVDESLKEGFPYPFLDEREERSKDARELLEVLQKLVEHLEQSAGDRFPPIPDEDPQPALRITPDV